MVRAVAEDQPMTALVKSLNVITSRLERLDSRLDAKPLDELSMRDNGGRGNDTTRSSMPNSFEGGVSSAERQDIASLSVLSGLNKHLSSR